MNSRHLTDITNTQQGTYIDNFPFPVRKTFPQKLNTRVCLDFMMLLKY